MKKIFTLTFFLLSLVSVLPSKAEVLWSGSKYVTWGNGLRLEASKFSASATPKEIVVTYTGATDAMEFKRADNTFEQLYFDAPQQINGDGTVSKILTVSALNILSNSGLEIIGANFTVTKVELNDTELSAGTLWKGYFWMDSWSTLPLRKDYFSSVNFANYSAIRFYHEANRTDFVMNIRTDWDESGFIANHTTMTMTNEYAELTLTDEIRTKLSNGKELLVQCNKEGGAPFNFTGIELISGTAGLQTVESASARPSVYKTITNGRLRIVKNNIQYDILGRMQ